jgi:hypothetical protein
MQLKQNSVLFQPMTVKMVFISVSVQNLHAEAARNKTTQQPVVEKTSIFCLVNG